MNSVEIETILRNHPATQSKFIGVFCRDQIPKRIDKEEFCIVFNTDKSTGPGEHWQAAYVRGSVVWFFDSFGGLPRHLPIKRFLKRYKICLWNKMRHQSTLSIVCGGYCVFFVTQMALNVPFINILKHFIETKHDDKFITDYTMSHHGYEFQPFGITSHF